MRRVCSILLLLGGSGALVYGSLFHRTTVIEENLEREVSILIPTPFGFGMPAFQPPAGREPGPGGAAAPDDANPFEPAAKKARQGETDNPLAPPGTPETEENPFKPSPGAGGQPLPFLPPDMMFQKVIEKYDESREEPEWVIVREATVGRLARLANGGLKWTYSGKGPALCPT